MTNSVVVYGKPDCALCDQTMKRLNDRGICYTYVDITVNKKGRKMLNDLGVKQLPYVVTDQDSWSGFRLEKIRGLPHSVLPVLRALGPNQVQI